MKRYVDYTRYSTDLQNEKSAEDQRHECHEYVKKNGGCIVDSYSDDAVSGGTRFRTDFQRLLEDISKNKFDVIIAEDLSRLSRDIEDTAYLYKLCQFNKVTIFTLLEREINEIHVGVKGVMNALYRKDGSDRVRRGLKGIIRDGRWPGKIPYGYEVDHDKTDDNGDRIRGYIKINPYQAQIIYRIFEEIIAGKSAIQIAKGLNADGIPGPSNIPWKDTVIRGNRVLKAGIINNEIYKGILVYNKTNTVINPSTGKKVTRLNPEKEWVREPAPDLCIVGDNVWGAAQARLQEIREQADNTSRSKNLLGSRRNKYLLSGKLFCGKCGKPCL